MVGGPVTHQQRETVAADVQMQILQQLQSVNKRLDNMEGEVANIKQRSACGKLSSLSLPKNVNSDHDSDSSSDESLVPSLNHLKSAKDIQRQVDSRLRELEECSFSPKGKKQKFKSKRGGSVDVIVSKRVPWPHDTVLGGSSRQRMSYDQLTWCQWVQGFARNILEEKSQKTRENMLHYLSDLMEDANDFNWHGAKAAHAVLMCDMERGAVTWDDTARIDRVRRAHAQKHVQNVKNYGKNGEVGSKRPWFCKMYQLGSCLFAKDHESNGKAAQTHMCKLFGKR